jgi:hypothetical protein
MLLVFANNGVWLCDGSWLFLRFMIGIVTELPRNAGTGALEIAIVDFCSNESEEEMHRNHRNSIVDEVDQYCLGLEGRLSVRGWMGELRIFGQIIICAVRNGVSDMLTLEDEWCKP